MDIQAINQWAGFVAALAPALLVLGALWAVWRTESLHLIARRLWLLVHGSQDISDPAIRAFVEEQSNLMAFRMFSRIRADTVHDAQQLIAWSKAHQIPLRTIAQCGEYFDVATRQVRTHKLPSRAMQWVRGALATGAYTAVVLCVSAMFVPQVAFTFKSDQRWFMADQTSARLLWPPNAWFIEPLSQSDCEEAPTSKLKRKFFTTDQFDLLCPMLGYDKWAEHISSELRKQRLLLALSALGMLWCTWAWTSSWRSVTAARKLALRGIDPSLSGSQLTLDF